MTETAETLNQLWAALLVEELVRNGVDTFCITPGSRSTPLTIAAARNTRADCIVHYDERGAAFFALGYARAAEKPAALICTSGTAAANYYPAIIEVAQARIPTIVLTADRPPELRETGANQTIRQPGMFGSYPRWHFDMPCPTRDIRPEFMLTTVDQAVYRATGPDPGPVHLNCPFREPLAPGTPESDLGAYAETLSAWRASTAPWTQYARPSRSVDEQTRLLLRDALSKAQRPLFVVGQLTRARDRDAVAGLVSELACPVFPGVASGLRLGLTGGSCISHFDLLLSSPEVAAEVAPDLVIHVGGAMVSKRFQLWLELCHPHQYVRIAGHPGREDPGHAVTLRIESDIPRACETLAGAGLCVADAQWSAYLRECQERIRHALEAHFEACGDLTEPAVAHCVAANVRESDGLFLGNSMPIRDMQRYAANNGAAPVVFANRGASGIDGNIATVAGIARGSGRAVTAILGDLAALHDLNSLALLRNVGTPVVLAVINNDGGGIFHFLPVATREEVFEPYFATPHGLGFKHACEMYGIAYEQPKTLAEFQRTYEAARGKPCATLIEVRTHRDDNAALHREIDALALAALRSGEKPGEHP